MSLKYLILLCLIFALAGSVGAQVPIPSRRVQTTANTPAATTRAPVGPPVPQTTPAAPPSFNQAKPLTTQKPVSATSTNDADLDSDKADITYEFPAVPVEQLLNEIYAPLVGRTLLMAGSGPEAIPTTATLTLKTESPLTKTEAIVALETVLGMNGISVVPIGDKFAKVIPSPSAGGAGGNFSLSTNLPLAGKFITQIVQVKYTSVEDLVQILKPFASTLPNTIIALPSTQTVILRDYAENVGRMLEMIKRIDILTPLSIKPEVIPIKYALASDIASALSALGASGGTSVGRSTSGATSFGGNGANGRSGFGNGNTGNGFGGNTGGYPGQPATSTTGGINSAATGARSSFQNNLSKIVQNAAGSGQFQLFGQTKIIADERTNSLLVFANDEDMKMIKSIIAKLDVVLSQVLIDAIVMEINLTGTQSTGISYLTQNQKGSFSGLGGVNSLSSAASGFLTGTTASSNGVANTSVANGSTLANLPGGFSYFAKFGNDLNVVLEAVAGDSRVNVLSRPRIQTSHAVPADLFIGNTVPYVTGTYNYGYGSGPSSQYTQLEVGIHLQVLPLINPDGLVVMDIQADVEQLGPDVQIAGVGGVPTTTKRQAGAKVAVRDGETIILGGFISDSRTTSDSGVPWLKDIPGLGNLFKSRSFQNLRTELIMLMRPTVLKTPEIAASVATIERNKLSGVKQAELEIRQAEEDRNAAIEAKMAKDADKRAKEMKKRRESDNYYYNTNNPSIKSIPAIEDAP